MSANILPCNPCTEPTFRYRWLLFILLVTLTFRSSEATARLERDLVEQLGALKNRESLWHPHITLTKLEQADGKAVYLLEDTYAKKHSSMAKEQNKVWKTRKKGVSFLQLSQNNEEEQKEEEHQLKSLSKGAQVELAKNPKLKCSCRFIKEDEQNEVSLIQINDGGKSARAKRKNIRRQEDSPKADVAGDENTPKQSMPPNQPWIPSQFNQMFAQSPPSPSAWHPLLQGQQLPQMQTMGQLPMQFAMPAQMQNMNPQSFFQMMALFNQMMTNMYNMPSQPTQNQFGMGMMQQPVNQFNLPVQETQSKGYDPQQQQMMWNTLFHQAMPTQPIFTGQQPFLWPGNGFIMSNNNKQPN